jgi:hypothetical protein
MVVALASVILDVDARTRERRPEGDDRHRDEVNW